MRAYLTYDLVENFISINGEGIKAGELAHFIRLRGCNLSCGYCDTAWANGLDCPADSLTLEQILQLVQESGVKNVTLTGGEPLLRAGMPELIGALMEADFHVEIETNGSVDVGPILELRKLEKGSLSLTVDYKLPESGQTALMRIDNYSRLTKEDSVKFVASNHADLEHAKDVVQKFGLIQSTQVYFSTAFGALTPADVVNFMKQNHLNGIKLQLQLHKYIWDPMLKGV